MKEKDFAKIDILRAPLENENLYLKSGLVAIEQAGGVEGLMQNGHSYAYIFCTKLSE